MYSKLLVYLHILITFFNQVPKISLAYWLTRFCECPSHNYRKGKRKRGVLIEKGQPKHERKHKREQEQIFSKCKTSQLSITVMVNVTYFTCTLGQASLLSKDRKSKNINEFIVEQAVRVGELPAVGFYRPQSVHRSSWASHVLKFSDVHRGTRAVADIISSKTALRKRCTVALLCPSNAEFLFLWLAFMWLGHPVLLLAPQCSAFAIAHLCETCEVDQLYYDEMYEDLSCKLSNDASISEDRPLSCISIKSLFSTSIYKIIKQESEGDFAADHLSEHDVAYLHHTSGTSSGVPKPIPQTHRAGVGVLPTLDGRHEATFTTTPLFHGGIADLFRAWTSDAMIWFFPDKGVPITPTNIVHCLETAQDSQQSQSTPQIKYFSSVPYVLQMMASDEAGLAKLQGMEIVGVGGAALPIEIGDKLVQQHVNLISRFGSAECGFFMSSHRDYANDKDWQYLRPGHKVNTVSFEQRDDGLSELIVLPGWPHMAKKNREDGSYATADLFQPHLSIKNAWRYHSRADSQLTLITGKKFDPAPLEAAMATSRILKDVFIFGDGKPYPGALLFRSEGAKDISDEQLITALEPMVEKINIRSHSHVRLARNMLVPMPFLDHCLDKSSKGTLLRSKAVERYANEIEQIYTKVTLSDKLYVEDRQVVSAIQGVVASIMGKDDELDEDMDLFYLGVDSVACAQIRYALVQLLPEKALGLPLTVVEDCGTISRLAELVISRRHGKHYVDDDPQQLMLDLVKKYTKFSDQNPLSKGAERPSGEVILLTGATGALGAHILHDYLNSNNNTRIFCLVRGASNYTATDRVSEALSSRRLGSLSSKAEVLCADLSSSSLGLDQLTYKSLASMVTTIHHVAWAVDFRLRVSSFSPNLASVQNLINFALSSPHKDPPNFIFCSSVASIANYPTGQAIPEMISSNSNDCGPLGYSRSKWVAESVCNSAHQQTRLRGRVAVMRVGQLTGATDTGIWSMKEAYPMMLSQASLTNSLPEFKDMPLTWLPVDIAARSFLEVAGSMKTANTSSMHVYHVVNTDHNTRWKDLLRWVKKLRPGLEAIPPAAFVEKLEQLQKSGSKHPAIRLIPHWKAEYGEFQENNSAHKKEQESEQKHGLHFKMENTHAVAPVLIAAPCMDEVYFCKIWSWVQEQKHSQECCA